MFNFDRNKHLTTIKKIINTRSFIYLYFGDKFNEKKKDKKSSYYVRAHDLRQKKSNCI